MQDSQLALQRIYSMLTGTTIDYVAVDQMVHQLKGSSASFGAQKITSLCIQLRQAVQNKQVDVALMLVGNIVEARQALSERLAHYVALEDRKRQAAGLA
jgi:histidine-containing phosphotransfer peotein